MVLAEREPVTEPKTGSATFGFSSWSVGYLPTAIAVERLEAMGYSIDVVELGGNSNQIQAAVQGDVDISAIAQIMNAMDEGAARRFFMGANTNEFIMVAKAEFTDCASLDGQRVAIHSESSFVGQLALQWFERDCPEADPEILIIEGSENRLAALLQDQIEASPIDLQDWVLLNNERPGEFVVTENFVDSFPVLRAAFSADPDWMAANEDLVKDWISVHLDVYEEIYADPSILVEKARELLPEIDEALLPEIVQIFIDYGVWTADGDLSPASVQESIDFFNVGSEFATIATAADVSDRTYLDMVLAER
jgi:ABC-type nitrate/sulfonate/bicarbonate transport system substrate-binding protein